MSMSMSMSMSMPMPMPMPMSVSVSVSMSKFVSITVFMIMICSVVDQKLFFPDSDLALTLISVPGSDLFFHMKNTFELQICRSSKYCKKADFLKPIHFRIRIVDEKYIKTADNLSFLNIAKKEIFLNL
jgi:hypothetical protein